MFSSDIKFYELNYSEDFQITENFSIRELYFATKLTSDEYITLSEIPLHRNAILIAQYLRDQLDKPINIGSAYRSPLYEASKNRSPDGSHAQALAIDLNSKDPKDLINLVETAFNNKNHIYNNLRSYGVTSFGFYDWGIHLDFRQRKNDNSDRFWDDRTDQVKKKV